MNKRTMLVIGLAGGVASGKSLVASCFEHFGATILDADRVGHEVLREPAVIDAIVSNWGEIVLHEGEINRKALAGIVFGPGESGSNELEQLESITHPRIGELIRSRLTRLAAESRPAVVLDAPVMFKSGWDQMCDKIVFVHADLESRQRRARLRGWDEAELVRRESRQISLDEKRSRSTDVIDNSGSKEETYLQARDLWRTWKLQLPQRLDSPSTLFPKSNTPIHVRNNPPHQV